MLLYDVYFSDIKKCSSKILVYTRQSYLFGSLPSVFPSTAVKNELLLRNIVHDDLESLKILKVSPDITEGEIEKHISTFMNDTSRDVFLLTANMQDVTVRMINYLRIIIEQHENQSCLADDKVVAIVLHFPQAQFFDQCYPALFLTGWDHYYLDSLTTDIKVDGIPKPLRNVVDIQQCFCIALCMIDTNSAGVSIDLEPLLEEAIHVISSRVIVGSSGKQYNKVMSISARQDQLKNVFFYDDNQCTPIGKAFCSVFHQYWDNKTVTKFLKDAARFTFSHQSTLSITSYIQTRIKALFFEFVLFLLWKINENCNMDTVFTSDTEIVQEIFAGVIDTLLPKLPSLHSLPAFRNLTPPKDKNFNFPFFSKMYQYMEELLDVCQEIVNKRLASKVSDPTISYSAKATKDVLEKSMFEEMKNKLHQLVEVNYVDYLEYEYYSLIYRKKNIHYQLLCLLCVTHNFGKNTLKILLKLSACKLAHMMTLCNLWLQLLLCTLGLISKHTMNLMIIFLSLLGSTFILKFIKLIYRKLWTNCSV